MVHDETRPYGTEPAHDRPGSLSGERPGPVRHSAAVIGPAPTSATAVNRDLRLIACPAWFGTKRDKTLPRSQLLVPVYRPRSSRIVSSSSLPPATLQLSLSALDVDSRQLLSLEPPPRPRLVFLSCSSHPHWPVSLCCL